MRRNLQRYYAYTVLSSLTFTWTTWFVFVASRGGNPGWAESAFHLAILLGEVPTGVVADLLGRRRSMLIGLVLSAASYLSYAAISDTLTACLLLGLSGLSVTFLSGADTALLYETAEALGGEDFARRALARASALQMATLAVAPVIAGWLAERHPVAPFLAHGAATLLAAAVVWTMREPAPYRPAAAGAVSGAGASVASSPTAVAEPVSPATMAEGRRSPWAHARAALAYLRDQPELLAMIAFAWVYEAVASMVSQFAQVYLPALGLSLFGAGVVFSAGRLLGAAGGWVAERLREDGAGLWLRCGPLGQAALIMLAGLARSAGGGAALVLNEGVDGLVYPLLSARINQAIPSAQRATVLSFQSLGSSLLIAAAFPAAAALPSVFGIYSIVGGAFAAAALVWALPRKRTVVRTAKSR
ncbi:MAG: MFS transporter [Symbiobacterium sp.]|uniref:MFS transporter n=1 Tax=Symbiobacterium sp. TaxID=1971213 RepID=UPI003463E922